MAIERETLVDVVVSLAAVGGFIVAVLSVGLSSGEGGMGGEDALVLIGLIVGFIVVMTAAGYWLSGRDA